MKSLLIKWVTLILFNLFGGVLSINEALKVENIFHDLMDKLHRLDVQEYLIHLKICDESTLDGNISLTPGASKSLMECDKLDDDQTWNETEGNVICIEKAFQGMSNEKIVFNILCNRTKDSLSYDPYTRCKRDYYSTHSVRSEYHLEVRKIRDRSTKLNYKVQHMKGLLKRRQDVLKCYKKSLGSSIDVSKQQKQRNYEFENEIFLNCYALNDENSRNESFDVKTESQKINRFIKCYELLNSNCYSIYNKTYLHYFNQFKDQNEGTNYQKFIITKMSGIFELISRCQTQEFGTIKAINYYTKQKEIFAKLNDCQIKALQLTQLERQQLQQRQYFYSYDF